LRECFAGKHPIPVTTDNVLGILSLIFWTLLPVISLKYMVYVLRADNRGEGGIFALLALLRPDRQQTRWIRRVLILLGLLGASILYGDAVITPAISVLSAVEGLQLAAPGLQSYVIPITVIILVLLFSVQSHGRNDHRLASGDHGRFFADTAGNATRHVSAAHCQTDVRRCARANLFAYCELDIDDSRHRLGACISFVGQSGGSLRCGGQLHHGNYDRAGVQRGARAR